MRPSMLPPTSITAPTSEIMPPKPAITATMTPMRASVITVQAVCQVVAPSDCTCWRSCGSTPITAAMVKPATRGKAMMVWAMIIAPGVNRFGISDELSWPSGPLRESIR